MNHCNINQMPSDVCEANKKLKLCQAIDRQSICIKEKYQAGGSYLILFKYMPFISTKPNIAFLDFSNKQKPGQI